MDGGTLGILIKDKLSAEQLVFIKKYEDYLFRIKPYYSFLWDYSILKYENENERNRISEVLGYLPNQKLLISGLVDPLFRASEQLMKYFEGCYLHRSDESFAGQPGVKDSWIENDDDAGDANIIHLVSWEFFANYFNKRDSGTQIRKIYSIENNLNWI